MMVHPLGVPKTTWHHVEVPQQPCWLVSWPVWLHAQLSGTEEKNKRKKRQYLFFLLYTMFIWKRTLYFYSFHLTRRLTELVHVSAVSNSKMYEKYVKTLAASLCNSIWEHWIRKSSQFQFKIKQATLLSLFLNYVPSSDLFLAGTVLHTSVWNPVWSNSGWLW